MNKSSLATPGSLHKAARKEITKEDAVSIKPPKVVPDPDGGSNHKYYCVYVSERFQQVQRLCTFAVWKKCEGRQTPGKSRTGLDAKLNCDFVMVIDKAGVVVDIDVIPKRYYALNAVLPDELRDKEDIILKFSPKSGGVEVTQAPPGVTKTTIRRLLDAFDSVTDVNIGDTLKGGYEVLNVSGSQVSVGVAYGS